MRTWNSLTLVVTLPLTLALLGGCSGAKHTHSGSDGGNESDASVDGGETGTRLGLFESLNSCDGIQYALLDEDLPRTALRLTPPTYPFTVTRVVYRLAEVDFNDDEDALAEVDCDASLEHKLMFATGSGTTPPTTADREIVINTESAKVTRKNVTVQGTNGDVAAVELTVDLDEPFVVESGSLFVMHSLAVEATGDDGEEKATCVFACSGDASTRDRNWYNGSTPVDWMTLYDYSGQFDNNDDMMLDDADKHDADLQLNVYGN